MSRRYTDVAILWAVALLGFAAAAVRIPAPVLLVLGLALFAAPGYVWSAVLLSPDVAALERTAVGAGLALAWPIFGGLLLFATGVPLRRSSWVALLAAATLAGAAVLTVQRWRAAPGETDGRPAGRPLPVLHIYAFAAAAVIAIAAVTLSVISAAQQKYPGYTQLSLTPVLGNARSANLDVANQQGNTVQYRLVLLRKGRLADTWNLTLAEGQRWQAMVPFTNAYPISADLYRLPDLSRPYRNVSNGIQLPAAPVS